MSINWAFSLFFFSCFQREWFSFFFQENDLYLLIRISLVFIMSGWYTLYVSLCTLAICTGFGCCQEASSADLPLRHIAYFISFQGKICILKQFSLSFQVSIILCLTELLSITHLNLAKLIYFHECLLWFLNSFDDVISLSDCTCDKLSLSALFFLIFVTWLSM